MATLPAAGPERTLLGHPRGLFVLFFTEMWERFSFYGMRGLLVLYLTKHFLFDKSHASLVYGAYLSLVYITPVIGGWLADRYLGGRKAVLFGGIVIAIGHFLLAFEGPGGNADPFYVQFFFLGLAFVITGTGFLKANISAIVGQLYARNDIRRDPAYTIFYMGINVGAFSGAILCGLLGELVGWAWGFGAAGVGMLAGLIVFVTFKAELLGRAEPPRPEHLRGKVAGLSREAWIYLGAIVGVIACWQLIQNTALVGTLLGVFGALLVGYILWTAVRHLPPVERDRIFAAMALIVGSILFWALFEQAGSSLNLFTDERVDRTFLGLQVPASVFQSINSFWIITMAPVLAWAWTALARRGWEPSAPAKFGLALIQVGVGFLVLVAGALAAGDGLTPAIFIFLLYFFHSTGELCLSPVGLSAMTKMALPQMAGLLMGTWFFATATGNFAAGLIASATGAEGAGAAQITDVYTRVSLVAIGFGVFMLVIAKPFGKLMHLSTLGQDDHRLAGQDVIGEPEAAGTRLENELKPQ
ncbi:peptide MFS transporter [Sphingomonas naphthae]|uniref:Peptide MFS transporter n=1 Tax=Sphingomonas naphthae TaxID=1813468 RepID=A0ABY7TMY7_9SPHN|nr:peptide MFS transporter [Sphingomonas naphthae]WCT74111.1 peptide MFS transporter [Sphingomonas naphthae]